ncbi:MAG TPA: serine hydrolase domain-containing protein [Thermoanaerobaculia bacterium]|jgi:CubicO group peptidase (beta-lactamase class C family)
MRRLLLVLLLAATSVSTVDDRVNATLAALNGTAEDWETYSQQAFTKSALSGGPDKRRQLHETLRRDFGKLVPGTISRPSPTSVRITLESKGGMPAVLRLEHEAEPPYRLTSLSAGIGAGAQDRGPRLPPPPIRGSMTAAELTEALDPYLHRLTANELFSGVVLIAKEGRPLFERAYGLASRTYGVPNRTSTRFDIGSINKMFTETAIARLTAEKKLAPGDTIGKHLPDYPNVAARGATIRQLLDHRGGFADFFPKMTELPLGAFRSNRDWYEYAAPLPLDFEPGTARQYCNSCFVVLGEIIERVSGIPYEQYIQRHVFDPAGMKQTGFFHRDSLAADVATGYTRERGPMRSNAFEHGAAGSAAGGAYSTAADLLAFERWAAKSGAERGYAGGAPGVNAAIENGHWTVIVLANLDPPAASGLAPALYRALQE